MADADTNARPTYPTRHVTIQRSERARFWCPEDPTALSVTVPWFKVAGRWLDAAGFEPRQRLKIEVEHERLVITPD